MRFLKFLIGFITYSFTALVIVTAAGLWMLNDNYQNPLSIDETHHFIVQPGDTLDAVAFRLTEEQIIADPFTFRLTGRVIGAGPRIQAGEYEITPGMSQKAIMAAMTSGKTYKRSFTIPEGLTSYEIVQRLNAIEDLSGEIEEIPEEGSLLPETYYYQKGDSRAGKIDRMQAAMTAVMDELWPARAAELPIKSRREALTLASIVEKETGVGGERYKVAGVFVNRLEINMPLQTDPTVIYALTDGKPKNDGRGPLGRRLLRKDLQFDSPYNTYLYPGLPPGPIANPGRAAIEATLNPAQHDYLYFVADGTGGHAFAETLDGHNRNVARWRKIRAASDNP